MFRQFIVLSPVVQHSLAPSFLFFLQAKLLEAVESKLAKHGPLLYQNASIAAGTPEWQQGRVAEKERYTGGGWPGVGLVLTGCIPLGMQCFLCGCRARQCGAAPALLSDRGRPCCSVQCPVQRCMCTMIAAAAALAPVARLPNHPAKTTLCHPLHTPAADHARFEAQLDHFELKQEVVVQKVGQRMDWSGWQRLRPNCLRPPTRPPASCFQPIALSLASSSSLQPIALLPAPLPPVQLLEKGRLAADASPLAAAAAALAAAKVDVRKLDMQVREHEMHYYRGRVLSWRQQAASMHRTTAHADLSSACRPPRRRAFVRTPWSTSFPSRSPPSCPPRPPTRLWRQRRGAGCSAWRSSCWRS